MRIHYLFGIIIFLFSCVRIDFSSGLSWPSSGQTYQITVRVEDSDRIRWGFELSARDQQGQQAGSLESTDSTTRVRTFSNAVQYVSSHQDAPIEAGGRYDFGFNWTAPDISAGPVMMHVAGNAADGDTTTSGDRSYTSSITIQCTNCSEKIRVDKKSGPQKITCSKCGTSGEIEL